MEIPDLLEIQELSVVYQTDTAELPVLREINLKMGSGQVYGIVGESGSGKTTLGLSVMHYLPPEGQITHGRILLLGNDLLQLEKSALRDLWGSDLSFVPQDPFSALNPSLRVGEQVAEMLLVHGKTTKRSAHKQTADWLARVRLPNPTEIAKKYPFELSGGQQQRILIAMALINRPRLLVLDEPTTSLDVTTEATMLDLLRDLISEIDTAALFITHNLGIVAGLTERVAVLYAGELVEDAPTHILFQQPLHPYTQGLLDSVPKLGMHKYKHELVAIDGQIPPLHALPQGCVFAPRCSIVEDICHQERPPLEHPAPERSVRCHRWQAIASGEVTLRTKALSASISDREPSETTLRLSELQVSYDVAQTSLGASNRGKQRLVAVDHVSLDLKGRSTLGIVGESGSGKSSLALAVMGLLDDVDGEMVLFNVQLPPNIRQRDKTILRKLQMVFQQLDEALPPNLTVEEILSRPLINLEGMDKAAARNRAAELLQMVRLPSAYIQRYPRQLSGGEKQRVAIAQAIAASPDLLLTDEPVSALDVSVQANILNLLNDLQKEQGTANLLISHDIAVVTYLADDIAVMYLGQVMQFSPAQSLLTPPYHPYTEALLSAIPIPDPNYQGQAIRLEGDIPSPLEKPTGCPFHTRCPRMLGEICRTTVPPWQSSADGKQIYCHIPLDELEADQGSLFSPLSGAGG